MEPNKCGTCSVRSSYPVHRNAATCSTHYEEVSEPEAPTLSLGAKVLWTREFDCIPGTVRWIGRIPHLCYGWTIGVEFDFPILNGGDGYMNGRRYFSALDGHALFLPSRELTAQTSFVQAPNTLRSHHMCSENSEEGCRDHYSIPYRDATYGHYKRSCHCSPRADHPCSSQCCGPVYDRISARQSIRHYGNVFENRCGQGPVNRQLNTQYHKRHRLSGDYADCGDAVQARLSPTGAPRKRNYEDHNGHFETFYQNGKLTPMEMPCRHSVFNPRSTISLINGFKEWVSCWVLGTSRRRRRKKQSVVLNGRKTVTSLIVSQSSQSMSKTGQRLSSFSNYSSVDYCTLRNSRKQAKVLPSETSPELAARASSTKQTSPENSSKNGAIVIHRRYKKGPAPLPPNRQSLNLKSENFSSNQKKSYAVKPNVSKLAIPSQSGKTRSRQTNDKPGINSVNVPNGNSSNSAPRGRNRRKRPAPPPPITKEQPHSGKENAGLAENNTTLLTTIEPFDVDDDWEIIPDSALFLCNSIKNDNFEFIDGTSSKNTRHNHTSMKGSLKRNSISVTDEESEEDMRNGITAYPQNLIRSPNDEASVSSRCDVFARNADARFKISIEKREMNVVTVEEVPPSSGAEEDDNAPSSLSEISDNEDTHNDCEEKSNTNVTTDNSKSSSSEENGQLVDPKPIFKELQLTPPPKACVKDFVNAFNMLADRERYGNSREHELTEGDRPKVKKMQGPPPPPEPGSKSMKSFPTKWLFQKNASNLLLPIAEEESHNEQSESEVDNPAAKSDLIVPKKKTNVKQNQKTDTPDSSEHDPQRNASSENALKPLSQKYKAPVKQVNKKDAIATAKDSPQTEVRESLQNRNVHRNTSLPVLSATNPVTTSASEVAVSSLLAGKPFKGFPLPKVSGAKMKSKIGKGTTKLDQPIMVSLYIEDKSSHLGPIPLLITPSMTLRKLKKQVEKEYDFDKDLQCWILGETFAIHDEATLASYGVIEIGCPILLYVMSMDSKTKSLPLKSNFKIKQTPIYDDVAHSSSNSDTEDIENLLDRSVGRSSRRTKHGKSAIKTEEPKEAKKQPIRHPRAKQVSPKTTPTSNSDFYTKWENELASKKDYYALMKLDDIDLVVNTEEFQCDICFLDIECGKGVVLQECLHSFCRECLAAAVQFSETALIKCPFRNDEYSCESHLQEREIKSLVLPEVFERHLQRSMALAESQASDSFHCKTPDCPGWCLYEDNVNTFLCPVCMKTNCVTCAAIHEGRNCRQYQDDVANQCNSSEEAKKTKEYLDNMVKDGEAMRCPKCEVILMKKWGCDWLKCSMCQTEVCWVRKGPRWGPGGRGDTSGGCKCMLDGVRCHPKCNYCH